MKGKLVLYGVVAVVVIVVGMFTVSSRDVVKYNDATVNIVAQMNAAFKNYDDTIGTYCDSKRVDSDFLKKEVIKIDASIAQARSQMTSIKVPDDDLCRAFHQSLLSYIKNSENLNTQYKTINEYVTAHNPPKEEDCDHVIEILKPLALEEEKELNAVGAAQKTMAQKHKIKLQ